jgi:hypothetical protein
VDLEPQFLESSSRRVVASVLSFDNSRFVSDPHSTHLQNSLRSLIKNRSWQLQTPTIHIVLYFGIFLAGKYRW